MLDSHWNDRGLGHNVVEPPKRKGIRTRCRRAAEKIKDSGTMLERAKGIWAQCQRRLKETGRDVGEDQEIRTWCRSRLKENGSSLGKYWRTHRNLGTMPEKRSYPSEYRSRDSVQASTGEVESGRVPKKGRIWASTGEIESGRVPER